MASSAEADHRDHAGTSSAERHASAVAGVDVLDVAGRHAEALAILDDALNAAPGDAWLHCRRGRTLYRWGRIHEARAASLRAAELGLASDDLFRQIGWCHLWTSDLEGADHWMARAAGLAPDSWEALFGYGTTALAAGRVDDAFSRFSRALELAPASIEVLNSLVVCHLDSGDPPGAEAAARRAIEVDNRQAMAWSNLGVALARQRRFDEARAPFERALELEKTTGDVLDSYVNYCNCLRDAGRVQEAIALYEQSLADRPNVNAHGDYAFTLMTVGRLQEGWREYEFRWMTNPFLRRYPGFDRPAWNGQDLRDRTILLWVEQGFGDTIQFIRYAPLVKALGATVLVMAREGLDGLLQECAGIDRILRRDEPVPPFDFHCPLMSLPRVFGTDLGSIPAVAPYLRPSAALARKWKDRLPAATKRRVGIVWAGSPAHPNDRFRSISLEHLSPVLAADGVQFVSLQKGPPADALASLPASVAVFNLGNELEDFADTLAVIDQLDLVICVDTSVAHLAGALGKPVWVLLPYPADFRWLEQRGDSPWYPSARLFRQDERRDWQAVVAQMAAAIAQWAAEPAGVAGAEGAVALGAPAGFRPRSPEEAFSAHRSGISAAARTRYGLMQYFPDEPLEGASLALYGESRQGQLECVAALIAPGATVVEVRAGVGAHSVAISRMIGPTGYLLAAEPRGVMQRVLRQNLAVNRAFNATLLCRGIGARPAFGQAKARAQQDATITGRVPETEGAIDTIDGLRLQRLDLLKIEEGASAGDVLAGAAETLWRLRPRLYIGVPDASALERVCGQVREFGYRCWRHESPLFNPVNFNRGEHDAFLGRTALALVGVPEEGEVDVVFEGCTELG